MRKEGDRAAHIARLLVAGAALLGAPIASAPGLGSREATVSDIASYACFDKDWPIGGDGCLFFQGALGPGDFFRGMRRIGPPDAPIFRKGNLSYRYFPDEISVLIVVTPRRCRKDGTAYGPWRPPPVDLLSSVSAQATYIEGLRPHPVQSALVEQGTLDPGGGGIWAWQYRFVVRTKGVELKDQLMVWLLSSDGKKLAQCPIRLGGPGELWPVKPSP